MPPIQEALKRLFITACMLTRTTDLATRCLGAGYFLPALFVLRYASMGGLDPTFLAAQLRAVRSFKDNAWCGHWNALATAHLDATHGLDGDALRAALSPLGPRVAHVMTMDEAAATAWLSAEGLASPDSLRAVAALRHLVQAITCYQISAFPGGSAARMAAYARSRALFHDVAHIVAPLLGMVIEAHEIEVEGDTVAGYLAVPAGTGRRPLVVITNGLEGTVQELAIPLLRYHDSGMAVFFMEMPGTYGHRQRMSPASEAVYHTVIGHLSRDARIDPQRLGIVGVSFGAHWAARLAATHPTLRCAVACGAPTHRSFQIQNAVGIPDIIIQALKHTTGATSLMGLGLKLKALSMKPLYRQIRIPLLVINGEHDTLLSTQDSVDLARAAQQGTLQLYPHDDHCAMGHYREWLDLSQAWLKAHLALGPAPTPREA